MPHAVGIDLGTTYSAVAYLDELGRSAALRNAEGDVLTPSVVLFDDAEVIVGKEAKRAAALHPDRVAECAKRDMGQPHYHRPLRGELLPPEVIQACVLRKLRTDAEEVLGPSLATVITVPAYFDEVRRKATADAGLMAGLSVLDIVNEPTAAALAFGEHQGYLNASGEVKQPIKVLVYDLGGGTFDVTVIDLRPSDVRTLATDGDVRLGGRDWDQRLADFAAAEFQKQHGLEMRTDAAATAALLAEVEDAKHTLSVRPKATVVVRHAGKLSEVNVTREQFEELTEDLLERTAYTTRQVLAAAGLTWSDINRVLLVGGSTRMPMVARRLEQLSGIVPDHSVHPDEAVARGAAIYAGYALRKAAGDQHLAAVDNTGGAPRGDVGVASKQTTASFTVTDVTAHSLGIIGVDQQTQRRENIVLIKRNAPLPARVTQKFVTRQQGQKSIVVEVLEGESRSPDDCTAIGRAVLRDLPTDLPAGWPVEVTSSLEANGRLSVSARLPGVDKQLVIELVRQHGLSGAGLERWQRVVGAAAGIGSFASFRQGVLEGGISPAATSQPSAPQQAVAPPKPTPPPPPSVQPIPISTPPVAMNVSLTDVPRWAEATPPTTKPAKPSHFEDDDDEEYRLQDDNPSGHDAPFSQALQMSGGMAVVSAATTGNSDQQGKDWGAEIAKRRAIANRRIWINVTGYIVFSLAGLLIGYYILANLTPTGNFLNLPLPGLKTK